MNPSSELIHELMAAADRRERDLRALLGEAVAVCTEFLEHESPGDWPYSQQLWERLSAVTAKARAALTAKARAALGKEKL